MKTNFKRLLPLLFTAGLTACATAGIPVILYAQVPTTVNVAWDMDADPTVSYNCYLDGVKQVSVPAGTLTCQLTGVGSGTHTAGVTAVGDPTVYVNPESDPATVTFKMVPGKVNNVKVSK